MGEIGGWKVGVNMLSFMGVKFSIGLDGRPWFKDERRTWVCFKVWVGDVARLGFGMVVGKH